MFQAISGGFHSVPEVLYRSLGDFRWLVVYGVLGTFEEFNVGFRDVQGAFLKSQGVSDPSFQEASGRLRSITEAIRPPLFLSYLASNPADFLSAVSVIYVYIKNELN